VITLFDGHLITLIEGHWHFPRSVPGLLQAVAGSGSAKPGNIRLDCTGASRLGWGCPRGEDGDAVAL
jgi:hypothetical protein